MTRAATATAALLTLDEDAWDDLREAAALVDALPPQLRALNDVKQWRVRIQQAQAGASAQRAVAPAVRSAG